MSQFYEMTLPIDSRDVDGRGYCKARTLLGHLQEAATQAAGHGGFTREIMSTTVRSGCSPGCGTVWSGPCTGRGI